MLLVNDIKWKVIKEEDKYYTLLSSDPRYKLTQKYIDRFFAYFNQGDRNECWLWAENIDKKLLDALGYGIFSINQRLFKAHRLSFALYYGFLEKDKVICHSCDNPRCVNPLHLWAGTQLENVKDRGLKSRTRTGHIYGEDNKRNKLTKKDVLWIRQNYNPLIWSTRKLAEKFNVCQTLIRNILSKRAWKNLNEENINEYERIGGVL